MEVRAILRGTTIYTKEIIDARSWWERLIWLCFIFVCCGFLAQSLYHLSIPFKNHETVSQVKREQLNTQAYPNLMICVHQPISNRLLKMLGKKFEPLIPFIYEAMDSVNLFAKQSNVNKANSLETLFDEFLFTMNISAADFDPETFINNNGGLLPDEIFQKCSIKGQVANCSEHFVIFPMGFINSMQCFFLMNNEHQSSAYGPLLTMDIFLKRNDIENHRKFFKQTWAGFDVAIFQTSEKRNTRRLKTKYPQHRYSSLYAAPLGNKVTIPLYYSEQYMLGKGYEKCEDNSSNYAPLFLNNMHIQEFCWRECTIHASMDTCACVPFGVQTIAILQKQKVCGHHKLSCLSRVNKTMYDQCAKKCIVPCTFYVYKDLFPSESELVGYDDKSIVSIYYTDLAVERVISHLKVSFADYFISIYAAIFTWLGLSLGNFAWASYHLMLLYCQKMSTTERCQTMQNTA